MGLPVHRQIPSHTYVPLCLSLSYLSILVLLIGLEPTRPCGHCHLKAACLPFHHKSILRPWVGQPHITRCHLLRWYRGWDSNPHCIVPKTIASCRWATSACADYSAMYFPAFAPLLPSWIEWQLGQRITKFSKLLSRWLLFLW